MAMKLEELVAQLRDAYGDALRSVVLYGSAAAGEQIPKRSDLNVLVVVDSLDLSRLQAASSVSRAWRESGQPAPLTLTTNEWRSSADIFPMEYADILERHRVLYGDASGDEIFKGISVSRGDLRWQLEHEAMGKLIHLRRAVLASGGDARRQLELLEASLSTFMVLFRSLLRLVGQEVPGTDYAALSEAAGRVAGFDAAPFVRVVKHTRGEAKLPSGEIAGVLAGYVAGAERFAAFVDQFPAAG